MALTHKPSPQGLGKTLDDEVIRKIENCILVGCSARIAELKLASTSDDSERQLLPVGGDPGLDDGTFVSDKDITTSMPWLREMCRAKLDNVHPAIYRQALINIDDGSNREITNTTTRKSLLSG